jgi:hypothetical protein
MPLQQPSNGIATFAMKHWMQHSLMLESKCGCAATLMKEQETQWEGHSGESALWPMLSMWRVWMRSQRMQSCLSTGHLHDCSPHFGW